jgi:RimJ/RimL family protein N-acetyltransferase
VTDAGRVLWDDAFLFGTERLGLRELAPADAADLLRVLSDPDSMAHYPKPFSADEVCAWIKRNIDRYARDGFGLWAVIRKADGAFLGDCGITLQNIDGEILPEVGFHIIGEYRRQGYASEAALASIRYARERFGLGTIWSYCSSGNLASQGVMRNIGMTFVKRYDTAEGEKVAYSI